ncbi:hypothetical protein [Sporolactobacillus terrae]|uniref:hypothetical protein n=1 Tax=Sporolactobacillus terrae TaxID=269673 RepID=UPI00159BA47F|nr:hypothetical protein [Sporolactobacillus terrae]
MATILDKMDLQSDTLKLHDANDPKCVVGGLKKYKKVKSQAELESKAQGYFFDSETKTLYVKTLAKSHSKRVIH